jgi:hypothetical protein
MRLVKLASTEPCSARQTGNQRAGMKQKHRAKKKNSPRSPVVFVVVLCRPHRTLSLPQSLGQSPCQASIRAAVRRASTASSRRVLRVDAHCAVSRRRCEGFASTSNRSFRRRRRRSRLGFCSSGCSCRAICPCFGGWWRWRRGWFGSCSDDFFKIRFGSPSLGRGCGVHAQPPSCNSLISNAT